MSLPIRSTIRFAGVAFAALLAGAPAARADDVPDLSLRYNQLDGREQLRFVTKAGPSSKPAGVLNWEFPPTGFATIGFETAPQTYCIEPNVSVVPGTTYPFRVESFGQPRDFGLKDDDAGRKEAARRLKFVRELYGKYYAESRKDSGSTAAFQTALWELVSETDVPDGPMPYGLFAGTFKADYKEADAPAFVTSAQKMVQSLTGDDTAFTESAALAPLELVRLTGMASNATAAAQSQLALRNRAGSSNIAGPFQDSAAGPTGGGGGLGGLLASIGAPRSAFPIRGGGGSGGSGSAFPFFGTGTTGIATGTTTPTTNPSSTTVTPSTPNPQGSTTPPTNGGGGGNNVPTPPGPTPVPAPPAVVLGLIALAAFGGRKVLARKNAG